MFDKPTLPGARDRTDQVRLQPAEAAKQLFNALSASIRRTGSMDCAVQLSEPEESGPFRRLPRDTTMYPDRPENPQWNQAK